MHHVAELQQVLRRYAWMVGGGAALAGIVLAVALRPLQFSEESGRLTSGWLVFFALVVWMSAGKVAEMIRGDLSSVGRAEAMQRTASSLRIQIGMKAVAVVLMAIMAGIVDNYGLLLLAAFPLTGLFQSVPTDQEPEQA